MPGEWPRGWRATDGTRDRRPRRIANPPDPPAAVTAPPRWLAHLCLGWGSTSTRDRYPTRLHAVVTLGLVERAPTRARDRRPQGTAAPLVSTQRQWRHYLSVGVPPPGLGIDDHQGPLPPQVPVSGSGLQAGGAHLRTGWGLMTTWSRYWDVSEGMKIS